MGIPLLNDNPIMSLDLIHQTSWLYFRLWFSGRIHNSIII